MDLLDAIARGFEAALGGGFQVLHAYSIPLLSVLAMIHLYMAWGVVVAQGGGGLGEALGGSLWDIIRIGIFYWGLTHLWAMGQAGLSTFVSWGAAAGGSPFTAADFFHPSRMWALGWVVAAPLDDFIMRFSGLSVWANLPDIMAYSFAKLLIIGTFFAASLTVLMAIIEFFMAIVAGAILIPWGVLSATSSLCEFGLSWIVGGCIRSFLTALIMAIGGPMFVNLPIPRTTGGDPTLFGAYSVAAAAIVLAVLVWQIPKRAALVAGRGMALGLEGGMLTAGTVTGWRAVTGVSRLVTSLL